MQDFNTLSSEDKISVRHSMQSNTIYNLTDSRDNLSYKIAKLADGNIWMAQSLNFVGVSQNLTSSNSNVTTTISSSTLSNWKSNTSSSYTQGRIQSWFNLSWDSNSEFNICAASAGTVCSNTFSDNSFTNDVCPAGWRMPTGADYSYLIRDYGNDVSNMTKSITDGGAGFLLEGGGFNSSNGGSVGYYWTSQRYDDTQNLLMVLNSSQAFTSYWGRNNGAFIRCLVKT